MSQIQCPNGGTVKLGETFNWENSTEQEVLISNCNSFLTLQFYAVPAMSGTTPGTLPATVKTGIAPGEYTYTTNHNLADGNPRMRVDSSMPARP